MIVRNLDREVVLATRVRVADTFGRRLRGLMFRQALEEGEGLLILPCQAVHTHFMRFPIDVLFLDEQDRVVRLIRSMRPWRQSPYVRGAKAALELPAGGAGPTQEGDWLHIG